jgi:FkbM family methyltransferase
MLRQALKKIRHYHSALGWRGVVVFCFAKLFRTEVTFGARIKEIEHTVYVRIPTTDVSVLKQVLIERHYDFQIDYSLRTIVDAGANIGLSAVFFANRFPAAKIVAIEPEESNHKLLIRNTAPYPNITPIRAALWRSNDFVSLVDPGAGSHGFQTTEFPADSQNHGKFVPATTVDELMSNLGWASLDLLKVDIEGAEQEVFKSSSEWINRVRFIMIELHDDIRPGCRESFVNGTRGFQNAGQCGESIMVFNPQFHACTPT